VTKPGKQGGKLKKPPGARSAETSGRFRNQSVSYRLRVNPPLSRKLGVESLGTFHPITYVGFHPSLYRLLL